MKGPTLLSHSLLELVKTPTTVRVLVHVHAQRARQPATPPVEINTHKTYFKLDCRKQQTCAISTCKIHTREQISTQANKKRLSHLHCKYSCTWLGKSKSTTSPQHPKSRPSAPTRVANSRFRLSMLRNLCITRRWTCERCRSMICQVQKISRSIQQLALIKANQ